MKLTVYFSVLICTIFFPDYLSAQPTTVQEDECVYIRTISANSDYPGDVWLCENGKSFISGARIVVPESTPTCKFIAEKKLWLCPGGLVKKIIKGDESPKVSFKGK